MVTQRYNAIRQFNELCSSNEPLIQLYEHTKIISVLNENLCQYLASPLNIHCQVANYRDMMLIINADTSAWATKLRYNIPNIENMAKHEWGLIDLKKVIITITPDLQEIKSMLI